MPLSLQHRHAVLLADRTRDIRTITTVVTEVLAANPETGLLDIETALRAAARQAYLVASSTAAGFQIVLGMQFNGAFGNATEIGDVALHRFAIDPLALDQNSRPVHVRPLTPAKRPVPALARLPPDEHRRTP